MKKIVCLMLILLIAGCATSGLDVDLDDKWYKKRLRGAPHPKTSWEDFRIAKDAPEQDQIPAYLTDPGLTKLQKLHRWVQNGLTEGIFYSVDVEYNEVRMDPGPWSFLPIEQKRIFVTCFSQYFDLKGSTGRVTIRSKYSDEKLASYSVWTGIKIYK